MAFKSYYRLLFDETSRIIIVYLIAHHYAGVASLLNNVWLRLGLRILFPLATASFRVHTNTFWLYHTKLFSRSYEPNFETLTLDYNQVVQI